MPITLTRPTKVIDLVTDLGLVAEHDAAQAAFDEARNLDVTDPREIPRGTDAARAVQAVEQRMKASTLHFTLQAWPRKQWAEWEATHPAVQGEAMDEAYQLHVADLDEVLTGYVAAGGHIVPSAIVGVTDAEGHPVEFDPFHEWIPLADEMSNGQWEDFAVAVMALNRGVKETPFSASASLAILRSEQTSKQQSAEGSASSD